MDLNNENNKKTIESVNYLIQRCHEDDTFKSEFIENPYNVIKKLDSEFSLPEGKEIVVEDQTDSDVIYFNIPKEPNLDELELTDEQLEMVSGGTLLLLAAAYLLGDGDININIHIGDVNNTNVQIGDNNQNTQ